MTTTLGELADLIRAKNAGPFWITLDLFFRTQEDYERVLRSGVLDAHHIGSLFRVGPESVRTFALPTLRTIKISFPRQEVGRGITDRDMHAGQQHVPLLAVELPD